MIFVTNRSRGLLAEKRSAIAVITAIIALPAVLLAGTPIDIGRQVSLHTALQNDADAAALAGATLLSESNYATDVPALVSKYVTASTSGLNATVQAPSVNVTSSSVTVTLTATMPTSFMAILRPSLPVTVSSTAGGPGATVTVTATPNGTGAADLNTIYLYAVNPDGTKDFSNRTILFNNSNSSTYPSGKAVSVNFTLGLGQRIAFELDNVTGGRNSAFYTKTNTTNVYGAAAGTTNVFYSSDYPATLNTDSTTHPTFYSAANQENAVNGSHVTFDNAATACYVAAGAPVALASINSSKLTGTLNRAAQQENVLVNGACANVTPGSASDIDPTCLELGSRTLAINWNDMGDTLADGDSDRYTGAYADMSYSYSCTGTGSTPNPYSQVVLTN